MCEPPSYIRAGHRTQLTKSVLSRKSRDSALSEMYFMTWKNQGHLASQSEFVRTLGKRSVKSIKLGLSRENQDQWDPYSCLSKTTVQVLTNSHHYNIFTQDLLKSSFLSLKRPLILNTPYINIC
jgi:hypothetical protein